MSIAGELGKLIGELNQSSGSGTLHFLGSAPSVGFGGGNFAKMFYDNYYVPNVKYFRKAIPQKSIRPKPILLRDKPRKASRSTVINNRVPVWKNKELNEKGYINWDSFLDEQKVMSFDFTKPHPEDTLTVSGKGIMVLEDPFTTKQKMQNNNLKIVKEGVDLTSLLLGMIGVCPRSNPYLKRITGFELAKSLKNKGLPVIQQGNWILIKLPETVGGFFGHLIKKVTHEIKQVGKKIQKNILDPVRDWMKSKIPGVWKVIDKFDRNAGITKSLKKFSKTVEDVAKKYGERVINMAIMAAATVAGGPAASMGASMLLKAADTITDQLTKKEKKTLKEVVKVGGELEKIDKTEIKDLTLNLFGKVKNELAQKKGKEGLDDFQKIINMARTTVEETEKTEKEAKKTTAGIGMTIMPLTQYNSFVMGCFLKAVK